jgi:TolB-like protein/class 3 adenylate cyclase/tetratricopeptide (TPR) repeat protein
MASEGAERRLAAILSADVVGYSRLMAEDEDATVARITAYREEIELLVYQHRGRLVDFTGDNCLAEFGSAVAAVQCATEIQRAVAGRNVPLPPDREMEFRIGVHLGEIRVEGGRLFGTGVNVAARLQALADPGGVCISGKVKEEVERKLALDFEDLGEQAVKNIPEPVHVYRVKMEEKVVARPTRRWLQVAAVIVVLGAVSLAGWRMIADQPVRRTAAAISSTIRSIAVLPLENLTGDPEQEYFVDGMTDTLISELARLRSLRVISRTSVMQYKQAPKPVPEIARELDVDAVIEGTVLRESDSVRISVQLIDARRDEHLWAGRFDRELQSVLALHSDVAQAVAGQIRLELTPEERAVMAGSRTVSPEAYDAYLRGLQLRGPRHLISVWGPPAIDHYERAVEVSPDFGEAWVALARVRFGLAASGLDMRHHAEIPKAREAVRKALEIDDSLSGAHLVQGDIHLYYDWDFLKARHAFEQAAQLSPNSPGVLAARVVDLMGQGRIDEALAISERISRIAPLDISFRRDRIGYLYYARRYERALDEAEWVREQLDPDFVDFDVANSYAMLGQLEEAHQAFVALERQCGPPCDVLREARERGWAQNGFEGATRAWVETATKMDGYPAYPIACAYAQCEQVDEAFAWLERAYRNREPWMLTAKMQPLLDPLRSDPRYQDLLRRIGFPEDS